MMLATLGFFFVAIKLASSAYCSKQLIYNQEYGYGTEIRCDNFKDGDGNTTHLSAYRPTYLQLKNSNLSYVSPKLFESVRELKILDIVNSTFILKESIDVFKDLKHLQQLVVENSRFGKITTSSFKSLEFLEALKLNNISISSLPSNSLKPLRSLSILDLSVNKFANINNSIPICEIPHLKRLILSENAIETLGSASFSCRINEDSLDFDLNAFKYEVSLPEPVYFDTANNKSQLIEINLSHNKLTTLSRSFEALKKLKYLNLEDNKLDKLHGYEFSYLLGLQKINLKSNSLASLNETVFSKNKVIKQIIVAKNKLVHVIFANLPLLSYLDLSDNNFEVSCIGSWKNIPKLLRLDLSYNRISMLPKDVLKNVQNVTDLNISGNSIVLENDTFEYLSNLHTLGIRKNNLTSLPPQIFKGLTQLKELDLSENRISDLQFDLLFESQINLEKLNLSFNKLERVSKTIFYPLKNLKLLDIEGNNLQSIDADIISKLPNLRIINIRNNQFSCEFLTDLLRYLQKKKIAYTAEKEVNVSAENVGGVPCAESPKPVVSTRVPETKQNISNAAKRTDPKPSEEPTSKPMSASTISVTTITLLTVSSLAGFLCYRYYKRRKHIADHFELIGE